MIDIEKGVKEYLTKVGSVDRKDIIEHDFREGIKWVLEQQAIQMQAAVKPDACGKWQKEKPNKPCLMVVKKIGLDNPEYQLFELKYYEGYLAVICDDGEEWGDYDCLQALEYYIIEYYDSKHSV